jgi:hypothetical protein
MKLLTSTIFLLWSTAAFASIDKPKQNVIVDVNNALLNIIINTSAALVDGPPEVAREIALIDGAMFDAVNTASGCLFHPIAYQCDCHKFSETNPSAAALQAALTVMNSLYGPSSLYYKYQGVTGATFYPSIPAYAGALVGPTLAQMAEVARQIGLIQAELSALNPNSDSLALGIAAGNAMLALAVKDGSQAAVQQGLLPSIPPNTGQPGVYVPPPTRPAMMSTWGTVIPLGITSSALTAIESTIPVADAVDDLTSQQYARQVLETECDGSSVGLPSNVGDACAAVGFTPANAEPQSALFWNDPGGTIQPPGHWLQIADTIALQKGLSLLHTARATASVGMATYAAGIGAWNIKYINLAWRPVDAIRSTASWNSFFTTSDPAWRSLIALPPHPDYIAGHPAFSGGSATALATVIRTDNVTFTSTSNNYCNGGATSRNSYGNVMSCALNGVTYSVPTICANGTPVYDGDPFFPTLIACTAGNIPQSITGGDCNNSGSQPPLNADYTANPLYNGSPLICVIAETYTSLSQASSGFLGAAFSRVVGGIHTPNAVTQATTLGNAVGKAIVIRGEDDD